MTASQSHPRPASARKADGVRAPARPEIGPSCDVLVLGSGLSGLRAAWAAAETAPGARVILATAAHGPSGSSFTNRNAKLGFLAPQNDEHREALTARAVELAAPGWADPALAALLMDEAAARLAELEALGVPVQRGEDGEALRHPSCFAPGLRCARLLPDLEALYARLMARVRGLGVRVLEGHVAAHILAHPDHGCRGAALMPVDGGPLLGMRAGAVVAALGGPAPLFAATLAGAGHLGAGWSYALLRRAGAELANEGFVQFFWGREDDGAFVRMAKLAAPGAAVAGPGGSWVETPPDVAAHSPSRATHCPASWGLPDAALDRFAAAHADERGGVTMRLPAQTDHGDGEGLHRPGEAPMQTVRALPLAHCGNGGARIDAHAATTVPGLFAAGECATGMHGADRLGGAMAAATQVFGRRAGRAAMRLAPGREQISDASFIELMNEAVTPLTHMPPPLPPQTGATALSMNHQLIDKTLENITQTSRLTTTNQASPALESALTVVRSLHTIV